MKRAYRRNAVAGPAHGARLAAVGAAALAPHAPLGPVARRHVAGALLLLVGHGTPETAVILSTSSEFKNREIRILIHPLLLCLLQPKILPT